MKKNMSNSWFAHNYNKIIIMSYIMSYIIIMSAVSICALQSTIY